MKKTSCDTCQSYKIGLCDVLKNMLLVNKRVVNRNGQDSYEHKAEVSIVIKDEYAKKFKCNYYKGVKDGQPN